MAIKGNRVRACGTKTCFGGNGQREIGWVRFGFEKQVSVVRFLGLSREPIGATGAVMIEFQTADL
jgi:hypothetical protein